MSRQEKAMTDNLYLIEIIHTENYFKREFSILGSTGNNYIVTISTRLTCSCPDFRIRKKKCKHIYFVLMRVMKYEKIHKNKFKENELEEMFKNIPQITENLLAGIRPLRKNAKTKKEIIFEEVEEKEELLTNENLEDICPICLDNLKNGQELDFCKYSCKKYIHKICFKMWCKKKLPTCVFCRGEWEEARIKKRNFLF